MYFNMFNDVVHVRSYYEDLIKLLLKLISTYERSSFYPELLVRIFNLCAGLLMFSFPLIVRKSNLLDCKVEKITKDLKLCRKKAQTKIKLKFI